MSENSIYSSLFDNFSKKLKKSSFVNRNINLGVGWKLVNISYSPIVESTKPFKGRQLPWGKIKITTKWINQDEGEYKNTCAFISGAVDKEFSRWRYLKFVSCKKEATNLQKVHHLLKN
ncbi:colanic acid biosynthesis glycosyltransferase WcaL [Acetobacteraceae bacterium]|nr:colanic acid biosynthesis glycosyltransferase WcaL [Acetobacteraceae bacterium]